ncbi:prostatic acid phosphatase-like [Haliotis asinina]|uniref:prostatic acid phosphatase-like n=1 Tax=Haliotis asinina TaxID=109174 RepID=UPI0035320794
MSPAWTILLALVCSLSRVSSDGQSDGTNTTLSLVQLLFRHGDRAPQSTYPTDQYQQATWRMGWGMLTDVGAEQSFDLGRFLKDNYKQLNFGSLTDSEVYVRSTSVTRARMTAECVMEGMLLANASQCNMKTMLQPVRVHYQDQSHDQLLSMAPCPLKESLKQEWRSTSSAWAGFLNHCKKMFKYLSRFTGWKVDETNILRIADALYCEMRHDLKQPSWMNPEILLLMDVYNRSSAFAYPTAEMQKLGAGPLLEQMLSNIKLKLIDPGSQMKLYMYSAHDNNIIAFLSALGVFNSIQPPYTACVMLELYHRNNLFFVKVLYRNDTAVPPYTLIIPGCAALCPIATFHRLLSNVTLEAESRASMCGSTQAASGATTTPNTYIVPLAAAGALILLAVAAVAMYFLHQHRHRLSKRVVNYCQLLHGPENNTDEDELVI